MSKNAARVRRAKVARRDKFSRYPAGTAFGSLLKCISPVQTPLMELLVSRA